MPKKIILFIAALLFFLNILCWQEVFLLSKPSYLRVDFLSVGQGDSELITTPENHHILIDGGPDSTVLTKLSQHLPFWEKNLDLVILTHPESDHMRGILDVLQRYNVKYFLWTGVIKNDAENKQLASLLEKAQHPQDNFLAGLSGFAPTKILTISAGQKIKAGKILIDILYPFGNLSGKELKNTSNDTCIVSKIIYGKNSFLLTGDISSASEKEIVDSGENISSDVLKVAHHGSKYSTSDLFLENVRPKEAVIEVGKNSFGHPTPEVLQRLEKFGIKIFRTDKSGDIEIISDGKNIKTLNN